MKALDIIKAAYDKSIQLSIYQNGKNNNNLHVVSYTDDMVTFLKGRKTFELPIEDLCINTDYSDSFYRDMYCQDKVGMTFDQLQSFIEAKVSRKDPDVEITQVGYKYGSSSAKRIEVTVNDLNLIAAMTYGTVTGVRFPDRTIVEHKYSVTSSQWQNRIL